ncbi:MAG: ATP-binding cassette domain-containing protein [Candidatus Cloacimonetes bacterium]|jgi:ABC-type lipoprotein export system ATPase subunit|nr:ATP-binding cassette domain-containing protein [Candidatus Cloacimonadota bacterium]MDD2506493.1 ATP-binding cassette domain-containing protein [Candidatus Cloacimonadota bacterium]MDD4560562.1 ATP-binding cassette domain-containing protein [Candidatus Cloacimonadota bacterium]
MIIEFCKVSSKEGLIALDLKLDLTGVILIHDPSENLSRAILNAMVGLDEILEGEILIDGIGLQEYLSRGPQIQSFGYVFDEGIMLSNLSLRENLMLPLKWLHPDLDEDVMDEKIAAMLQRFRLDMDLSQRPAKYRAGELKLLSFVRTLLIEPKVLLLDDPYYVLNKNERAVLLNVLSQLRSVYPMLIASIDDDFGLGFAEQIIDLTAYLKHLNTE